MKKILFALAMLSVLFSAPVAFAQEGLTTYVINRNSEARRVELTITTSSGAGAGPMKTVFGKSEIYFDFDGHDSEDQTWKFTFIKMEGGWVGQATINYSGGKFTPVQVSEGVTYFNLSEKEIKLELAE